MTHPPRTPPTVEEIPGYRPKGLPSLSPTHGRQSETSLDVIPGRNEPFSGVRGGPFGCILADPPWAFRQWSGKNATPHRGAHDHYATTETVDLALLPVADIAADDCALFMWVVDSHFAEALDLGRAWGFEFKTCAFVWVKSKRGGYPHVGMGYWTRKQTEQCWLFTRGSPRRLGKGVEQIIHCPRGAHSAKPDLQYDAIERLVGGPRLEMFARSRRPGWSAWGNEVGARDGALFEAA